MQQPIVSLIFPPLEAYISYVHFRYSNVFLKKSQDYQTFVHFFGHCKGLLVNSVKASCKNFRFIRISE